MLTLGPGVFAPQAQVASGAKTDPPQLDRLVSEVTFGDVAMVRKLPVGAAATDAVPAGAAAMTGAPTASPPPEAGRPATSR